MEKLQKILTEINNNWIERKKRLEGFIHNEVENGPSNEAKNLGLDEKEFAFFEVIKKYLEEEEGKRPSS